MSEVSLVSAPAKRIFISHAKENDTFVRRLAIDLRANGYFTWADHENLITGEDWDDAITLAINYSYAVVVVLSPISVKSLNVKSEWSYGLELKKPVYPVLLEDCLIPVRLRVFQWSDFTKNYRRGLSELLKGLNGIDLFTLPGA